MLEEQVLAGQGDVPSARQGALPHCHPAHEGTLLRHTAITPAPSREEGSVQGTLVHEGGCEKVPRVFHVEMLMHPG